MYITCSTVPYTSVPLLAVHSAVKRERERLSERVSDGAGASGVCERVANECREFFYLVYARAPFVLYSCIVCRNKRKRRVLVLVEWFRVLRRAR